MDTVLFTDTTAAAADAPLSVIETSAWLSSNIRYEILSPSVMVFDDSIVVYDAKEVETNRLMAVKRYKLPPGGRGALVKRIIEAEQEILVAVQGGPHILTTGVMFRHKGGKRVELYMEHYQHRLSDWMDETISSRAIRDITIQIPSFYQTLLTQMLQALKFIHSKGIIHCAVLPPNIVYNNHGHFVLSEFTFARWAHKRPYAHHGLVTAYMAPEVFDNQVLTVTSDLWSLAVILLDLVISLTLGGADTYHKSDGLCRSVSELGAELGQYCELSELEMMLKMSPIERLSANDLLEHIKHHPRHHRSTREASAGVLYGVAKLKFPDRDQVFLRDTINKQYEHIRSRPEYSAASNSAQSNVGAVPPQQGPADNIDTNSAPLPIIQKLHGKAKSDELPQDEDPMLSHYPEELATAIVESAKLYATTESIEMNGITNVAMAPSLAESQSLASSPVSRATISSAPSQKTSASSSALKKRCKSGASKRKIRRARDAKMIDSQNISSAQISPIDDSKVSATVDSSNQIESACLVPSDSESSPTSGVPLGVRQEPVFGKAEPAQKKKQETRVRQAEEPGLIQQEELPVKQATDSGLHQANESGHIRPPKTEGHLRAGGSRPDREPRADKEESGDQAAASARESSETHKAVGAGPEAVKSRKEEEAVRASAEEGTGVAEVVTFQARDNKAARAQKGDTGRVREEKAIRAREEKAAKVREEKVAKAREEKAVRAREEKAAKAREEKAAKAREEMISAREAIRAREETARAIKAARGVEAARHRVNVSRAREVRKEGLKTREEAVQAPEAARAREARESTRAKEMAKDQKVFVEREEIKRIPKMVAEREGRENSTITKATTTQSVVSRLPNAVPQKREPGEETAAKAAATVQETVRKPKPTGVLWTDVIQAATTVQETVRIPKPTGLLRTDMIQAATTASDKRGAPTKSSIVAELADLKDRGKITSSLARAHSTPDVSLILREQEVYDALEVMDSRGITGHADIAKILERPGVLIEVPADTETTKALIEDASRYIARAFIIMRLSSHPRTREWQSLIKALAKESIAFSVISLTTRGQDTTTAPSRHPSFPTAKPDTNHDPIQHAISRPVVSNKTESAQGQDLAQHEDPAHTSPRNGFPTPSPLSAHAPAWDPWKKRPRPSIAIDRAHVQHRLPPPTPSPHRTHPSPYQNHTWHPTQPSRARIPTIRTQRASRHPASSAQWLGAPGQANGYHHHHNGYQPQQHHYHQHQHQHQHYQHQHQHQHHYHHQQHSPQLHSPATNHGQSSRYAEGSASKLDQPLPAPRPSTPQEVQSMRRKWELAQKLRRDHRRMQEGGVEGEGENGEEGEGDNGEGGGMGMGMGMFG